VDHKNNTNAYLANHQYEKAIIASLADTNMVENWDNYSISQLCLGNLIEAEKIIDECRRKTIRYSPQAGGMLADFKSTIQWLRGRRDDAVKTLLFAISGIENRTIIYADRSGGCDWGLLLWFMASIDDRADEKKICLKYLKSRTKRKAANLWPGPLGRFVTDQMSESSLMELVMKSDKFEGHEKSSLLNEYRRDEVVRTIFYVAEKNRQSGKLETYLNLLDLCVNIKNPLYTPEWYLARQMLNMNFDCRPV
jgi:hypothetical protein